MTSPGFGHRAAHQSRSGMPVAGNGVVRHRHFMHLPESRLPCRRPYVRPYGSGAAICRDCRQRRRSPPSPRCQQAACRATDPGFRPCSILRKWKPCKCMAWGQAVSLIISIRTVSPKAALSRGFSGISASPLNAQTRPCPTRPRMPIILPPIIAPRMPPIAPPSILRTVLRAFPRSPRAGTGLAGNGFGAGNLFFRTAAVDLEPGDGQVSSPFDEMKRRLRARGGDDI